MTTWICRPAGLRSRTCLWAAAQHSREKAAQLAHVRRSHMPGATRNHVACRGEVHVVQGKVCRLSRSALLQLRPWPSMLRKQGHIRMHMHIHTHAAHLHSPHARPGLHDACGGGGGTAGGRGTCRKNGGARLADARHRRLRHLRKQVQPACVRMGAIMCAHMLDMIYNVC